MSERDLIRFRPDGPGRPKRARAAWIHWPALAFRVRARVPPRRVLDVLEELVLRLAIAGYRSVVDVTAMSALAPELVEVVIGQLSHRGFMDANGPTEPGRAILGAANDDDAHVTLGWMMRCQLSGQVMPLFCEGDLPPSYTPQGILRSFAPEPVVTREDPQPLRDFHVALQRWRVLLQVADVSDRSDEDYDARAFPLDPDEAEPAEQAAEAPALSGASIPVDELRVAVEVLDETPRSIAIRTLTYLPQDPRLGIPEAEGLLVRHPFGIPGGDWFSKRLGAALLRPRSPIAGLREWARASRDYREKKLRAEGITIADLAPLGQQKILDLVGTVEGLSEPLERQLSLLGEALVRTAKRPDRSYELWACTCTLLEILLDEWIVRYGSHRAPPSDWAGGKDLGVRRRERINAAANKLKLPDVPHAFFDVDAAGLERAVQGKGDLRDRMVLVLVDAGTAGDGRHPLPLALREEPALVEHMDFLRRNRNRTIHYRRGQAPPRDDGAAASEIIGRVEKTVRALFLAWGELQRPAEDSIELDL